MKNITFTLLLCLFIIPFVQSTNYLVMQNGSGNYTTIQNCANVAVAGDECRIFGGYYNESVAISASGNSSSYINFTGGDGNASVRTFTLTRSRYITIQNLKIWSNISGTRGIVLANTSNVSILNNEIYNTGNSAIATITGNTPNATSNWTIIRNNIFSYIPAGVISLVGYNNLIEGNDMSHHKDCVYFYGSRNVIRNNTCRDSNNTEWGAAPDAIHFDAFQYSDSGDLGITHPLTHLLIEKNYMANVSEELGNVHFVLLQEYKYPQGANGSDTIVRYNNIQGVSSAVGSSLNYTHAKVYNNDILNTLPNSSGNVNQWNVMGFDYQAGFNKIINNIFYNTTRNGGWPYDIGNHDVGLSYTSWTGTNYSHNLGYNPSCGGSCTWSNPFNTEPNVIKNQDPLFVTNNTNLSLQLGSPAIDSGGPLTFVETSDGGSGTGLVVNDSKLFQDGWAGVNPDWIAVGNTTNIAQIVSINYTNETITLDRSIARNDRDSIYLYKDSFGIRVLYGNTSDIGAFEFVQQDSICSPNTYYVDYDSGSDSNYGNCTTMAWKHAPGDLNATGNASSVALRAGDTILFKGGARYRGEISIPASGNSSGYINYDGDSWPGLEGTKAIIDGSEQLTNWTRCTSQNECGGNSNWQSIYYSNVTYPSFLSSNPALSLNLYQGEQALVAAQTPRALNDYYRDKSNYFNVSISDVTNSSLTDSRLANLGINFLNNSYIYMWVNPNTVTIRRITSVDSLTNTINFSYANTYTDRETLYAIANNINDTIFDVAGEYYLNETIGSDGSYRLYVWPLNNDNLTQTQNITSSFRSVAISLNGKNYISLEGFIIEKQTGDSYSDGASIIPGTSSGLINFLIKNNEFARVRGEGIGTVSFTSSGMINNSVFEGNYMHHTAGSNKGFQITGFNATVRNNIFNYIAGTTIYFSGTLNSSIINNTLSNSTSAHSNGISVYSGSDNNVIANNYVVNSNLAFTFEQGSNFTVINNIFLGEGVDCWGSCKRAFIANNLIEGEALLFSEPYIVNGTIKNNIFLTSELQTNYNMSNNSFTDVEPAVDRTRLFTNSPRYRTIFESLNKMNITNQTKFYVNPAFYNITFVNDILWYNETQYNVTVVQYGIFDGNYMTHVNVTPQISYLDSTAYIEIWPSNTTNFVKDYTLRNNSIAINNGSDLSSLAQNYYLGGFNIIKDILGVSRPIGSAWDIGPYESLSGNNTFTLSVGFIGTGAGNISGTGIYCNSNCTIEIAGGTNISLVASPAVDSLFFKWRNAECSGITPCNITNISQDKTITAEFYNVSKTESVLRNEWTTNWSNNAGFIFDIPDWPNGRNAITDEGAVGDGITDDTQAIQRCINNTAINTFCYLPAGNYSISSTLILGYAGASASPRGIRGAGSNATFILASNTTGNIMSMSSWGPAYEVSTVNATRGSKRLYVNNSDSDFSSYVVGDYVLISQENGEIDENTPAWVTRAIGQYNLVTAKGSNYLDLQSPLYYNYNSAYNASVRRYWAGPQRNVGIENLTIDRVQVAGFVGGSNIVLQSCVNCWVRNVKSLNVWNWHVNLWGTYGNIVRDSWFEQTWQLNCGGNACYGTQVYDKSSDNLIENNFYKLLRHSMITESGGAGNIFGYSYSRDPINENGMSTDYLMGDMINHGGHAFMNLFEGNTAATIRNDNVLGSNWGNTFFRNNVQVKSISDVDTAMFGIDSQTSNLYNQYVGNIFGKNGNLSAFYRFGTWQDTATGVMPNNITIPDPRVNLSVIVHGNVYFQQNNNTANEVWDANISNTTIPNSLYYNSKPSWFVTNISWPPVGPEVSDYTDNIPAKQCYDRGEMPNCNLNTVSSAPVCGNSLVETGEACDGSNMSGFSCNSVASGMSSGSLACSLDCKSYDISQCLEGNVINATSCSLTDVQNAIGNASTGDIVDVPAGNCTWNSSITIGKAISIKGNGATLNAGAQLSNGFFHLTAFTSNALMRISNFTFVNRIGDIGVASANIKVGPSISLKNLRIDNNIFHYGYESIDLAGAMGVIENNYFYNGRKGVSFTAGNRSQADDSWNSLEAGTGEALFVENNHFITDYNYPLGYTQEQIGTSNGGKLVIRYNTFNSSNISITNTFDPFMAHGSADGGCNGAGYWENSTCQRRGQSVIEFYSNIEVGRRIDFMYITRGSANLVYNNTILGTVTGNPRIYLREEEYSASDWNIYRTSWPAEDQVHNTFIWNNSYRGYDFNQGVYGSIETSPTNYDCTAALTPMSCCTGNNAGTCGSNSNATFNPFLRKDRDYFLHAPCRAEDVTDGYGNNCTYGKATFIGLNGASNSSPTDGITYPNNGTMIFTSTGDNAYTNYVAYPYPHPLAVINFTVSSSDLVYPNFSNYSDNSGTLTTSGTATFNVIVLNTNGTVMLQINNVNYTATNLTSSGYNVSVALSSAGSYTYYWHAFGNGSSRNINSTSRSYTVNSESSSGGDSGSSSGGGGGGGGAITTTVAKSKIYYPGIEETFNGYEQSLNKEDGIEFLVVDFNSGVSQSRTLQIHNITVNSVSNSYVNLTIRSNPINLILFVGQNVKLNLTSSSFYDLYVELKSIKNGKAELLVKNIEEEIPAQAGNTAKNVNTMKITRTEDTINRNTYLFNKFVQYKIQILLIFGIILLLYIIHKISHRISMINWGFNRFSIVYFFTHVFPKPDPSTKIEQVDNLPEAPTALEYRKQQAFGTSLSKEELRKISSLSKEVERYK